MSDSHSQLPGGINQQQPFYRRSSYASIVSGAATASNSHPFQPATRAASNISNPSPSSTYPPPTQVSSLSRSGPRVLEMDGLGAGPQAPWSRGTAMASAGPFGNTTATETKADTFFIPAYLEGSRYADQLRETHRARLAAQRDARSPYSSTPGSLSTSSSSVNLPKMVPSHRGMTHDIIERAPVPTFLESSPPPLPSRWSETDKYGGLELTNNGLDVKFTSLVKPHDEAGVARADYPIPKACGIYYFETTVGIRIKDGGISVGFLGPKVTLNRYPGFEPDSWAFHGDDGTVNSGTQHAKEYGPGCPENTVIGCGVNFRTGTAFYTRNGVNLGVAFKDIRGDKLLYPCVGIKKQTEYCKVNFGQTPFVFDIESMFRIEKAHIMDEVKRANVANLNPPFTESQLIHKLIAQYLAHDGYVETARAFATEVQSENDALTGATSGQNALELEEDRDAVNRQKIRTAILEGDIDAALEYTSNYYPTVLSENENIYFKLRCRKFIEMIRQCTSLDEPSERRRGKKAQISNGRVAASDEYSDVFEHQMELDEQLGAGLDSRPQNGGVDLDWGSAMDTSEDATGEEKFDARKLLDETIQYGQELRSEFSNDPRREVKRELENTLALIAYDNPKESSLKELLEEKGRTPIAEELNGAILVSLGKSASAALERMLQQTEVMLQELGDNGGHGAFINLRTDFLHS